MLVQQWEEVDEEGKDVQTYVKDLKETLHDVWEATHTCLKDAQEKQKRMERGTPETAGLLNSPGDSGGRPSTEEPMPSTEEPQKRDGLTMTQDNEGYTRMRRSGLSDSEAATR
ncbi:hypothetical protein NDU88_007589 [Pleurodeles waltl]|uniref:Uncharacterized protein n=1 Tax=Pleurodeles waltl TaxID=8319 RepID=A0AAV7RQQ3_PLEWA|nr:hypothetical protein NDU88_007589 [Pleurodeles waltl]